MTIATDLQNARALIDAPDKWCQHQPKTPAGQMCSWGAIGDAITATPDVVEAEARMTAAAKTLARGMGTTWGEVARWNDTHTYAEVMVAWDRAIAIAQAVEAEHHVAELAHA
jgi:hypothetical protein